MVWFEVCVSFGCEFSLGLIVCSFVDIGRWPKKSISRYEYTSHSEAATSSIHFTQLQTVTRTTKIVNLLGRYSFTLETFVWFWYGCLLLHLYVYLKVRNWTPVEKEGMRSTMEWSLEPRGRAMVCKERSSVLQKVTKATRTHTVHTDRLSNCIYFRDK